MTGTAILWLCLKLLGADVGYYVPHRIDEGYGLNCEAIRSLAADKAEMIVTVDCGIASVDEATLARELGVELIVTDHHEPGPQLPEAAAIVHPRLPGGDYPFGGLSGSGVALKLAWALCQQASGAKTRRPADEGFSAAGRRAGRAGHRGRRRAAGRREPRAGAPRAGEPGQCADAGPGHVDGASPRSRRASIPTARRGWTPRTSGFQIAPRLNAAGRLGQPQLAVELLVTDRPERAQELAQYIDGLNATRQTLERSIQLAAAKQAKEQFDPDDDAALVLADRGWHPGVIGIVAGRLAEKVPPAGGDDLVGQGGHAAGHRLGPQRAGLQPARGPGDVRRVPRCARRPCGGGRPEDRRAPARRLSRRRSAKWPPRRSPSEQRVAELSIDAEAPLSAFTLQTVQQIERLAPFGQGNARPLLCTTGVTLAGPPKPMGTGGHHLSLKLSQHGVTLAGGGLRRRRMGRRTGRARRPARRRLSPGDQQLPRPAERRTAPGRLAGDGAISRVVTRKSRAPPAG